MAPKGQSGQPAGDEGVPSPEELLAMFDMLQQQGVNMDHVPPDLKTMLENVKKQKAAKGGPPVPDVPTEEITPDPGFVIKTSDTASGRKVFINVCSSDRVAAPGGWAGGVVPDEVAAALEKVQGGGADSLSAGEVEALRFPLACGPPHPDTDRKGEPCTAVDVVFATDVVRAAAGARKLKALLIEIATGHVGEKLKLELDPRYKLPKMRYKGEVVASQRIRADDKRKKLVTELRDIDDEPSFALRTSKAPQPPPQQQQQQQQQQQPSSSRPAQAQGQAAGAAAGPGPGGIASGGGGGGPSASKAAAGKGVPAATGTGKPGGAAEAGRAGAGGAATLPGGGPPAKVEYEGRPVEWICVTVELPGQQPAASASGTEVAVEVAGRSLYVRAPGHPELHVPLLFAASAEGATAAYEQAAAPGAPPKLLVRLPYRSLDEYLADAQAQAPLSFGQLNFASRALLELEP